MLVHNQLCIDSMGAGDDACVSAGSLFKGGSAMRSSVNVRWLKQR